ncbi:MAG: hypothetical protein EBX92_08295 [Actinobacteria bacterium]|nr:hypothetical protein [Actinomycetota bacterium]
MVLKQLRLSDVARAISDPISGITTWLSFDGTGTEQAFRHALLSVLVSYDEIALATYRSLAVSDGGDSVKAIAERFGLNPSAISQRRTRMANAIATLREGELPHAQLIEHLRSCLSTLVCTEDLPTWVKKLASAKPAGECNEADLALLILNMAVNRPRLILDEDRTWLAATRSLSENQPRDPKSFAQLFVDEVTGGHSCKVSDSELDDLMINWGVAPLTVSRFKSVIRYPARRSVAYNGEFVLLSQEDGKNASRSISAVSALLKIEEDFVIKLMVEQHGRAKGSLSNEMTNRRK